MDLFRVVLYPRVVGDWGEIRGLVVPSKIVLRGIKHHAVFAILPQEPWNLPNKSRAESCM